MGILDFVKAFNKVSYQRLDIKMSYYSIRNGTLNCVTEFVPGHQQQDVIDGETSEPANVTSGDPQGTVLGPTLLLVYIIDIADYINSTRGSPYITTKPPQAHPLLCARLIVAMASLIQNFKYQKRLLFWWHQTIEIVSW